MQYSSTIFGQSVSFLSKYHFDAVVGQHAGDYYTKKYSAWNELVYEIRENMVNKVSKDIEKIMESVMSLEESKGVHLKAGVAIGNTWGELK